MVTLKALRGERRDEILRLASRRGAHAVRVFWSVACGRANAESDLDLLVAWEPGLTRHEIPQTPPLQSRLGWRDGLRHARIFSIRHNSRATITT